MSLDGEGLLDQRPALILPARASLVFADKKHREERVKLGEIRSMQVDTSAGYA
jgi:hypothetical protein